MDDRDDELAEAIRELSLTLRELRDELGSPSRRRRRLLVRPPSPRELLRFADEVALPTVIAVLEANVRALEAFQRSLRLVRRERETRERAVDATESTRERADELRRTSLERLDAALNELGRAISSDDSRDDRAHELLEDARALRGEVDRRLRDLADSTESTSGGGRRIEIEDGTTDTDNDRSETDDEERGADADTETDERDGGVDVDAELETLKDRYGPPATDEEYDGRASDESGSTDDPDDTTDSGSEKGDGSSDIGADESDADIGADESGSDDGNDESSNDDGNDDDETGERTA